MERLHRRFFTLPTGDQTAELVCVTPATWNRAIELGVVPERAP